MISLDFGQFEKLDFYHLPAHCAPAPPHSYLNMGRNMRRLPPGRCIIKMHIKITNGKMNLLFIDADRILIWHIKIRNDNNISCLQHVSH